MKRRNLLNCLALGTASGTTLAACSQFAAQPDSTPPVSSQPIVQWRMATSWTKSLDIVFSMVELICQRVSRATNGRFIITPYEAGEIVPGLEVLDAVSQGTAECGHTASYYYLKKNAALAFATTVPFGLNAQQHAAWLYFGDGLEVIQKLYADYGVINFPAGSTGAQMGGWFTQEIASVDALKGLKMRIPGLGGQVMERLGVDVQVLAGDEIFAALESGAIEAAEWVGPYEDEKLGLNRIAPFYYYPGWWEPGTTYEVQVNRTAWDKLPAEYQAIFQSAAAEANLKMQPKYDAANGEALERLILRGTKLMPYKPEILQAARQAAFDLYEETAKTDATFKSVYEQWKVFRQQVYRWNQINELSFSSFAFNQTP